MAAKSCVDKNKKRKRKNHEIYYAKNRESILAKNKEWRDNNKDKTKQYDILKNLKKFGLTLEDYERMLKDQNYVCATCFKPESVKSSNGKDFKSLSVDHCHETGKVRGLLCHSCNAGIGLFRDDIEVLNNVIKYLEDF